MIAYNTDHYQKEMYHVSNCVCLSKALNECADSVFGREQREGGLNNSWIWSLSSVAGVIHTYCSTGQMVRLAWLTHTTITTNTNTHRYSVISSTTGSLSYLHISSFAILVERKVTVSAYSFNIYIYINDKLFSLIYAFTLRQNLSFSSGN